MNQHTFDRNKRYLEALVHRFKGQKMTESQVEELETLLAEIYQASFFPATRDDRAKRTNQILELQQKLDAAQLEISRLRESLQEIVGEGHSDICRNMKPYRPNYICHVEIAEQALNLNSSKPTGGEDE